MGRSTSQWDLKGYAGHTFLPWIRGAPHVAWRHARAWIYFWAQTLALPCHCSDPAVQQHGSHKGQSPATWGIANPGQPVPLWSILWLEGEPRVPCFLLIPCRKSGWGGRKPSRDSCKQNQSALVGILKFYLKICRHGMQLIGHLHLKCFMCFPFELLFVKCTFFLIKKKSLLVCLSIIRKDLA